MKARTWRYFTPYRDDPEEVLQLLRAEEFAAGRFTYSRHTSDADLWEAVGWVPADPGTPAGRTEAETQARVLRAARLNDFVWLTPDEEDLARQLQTVLHIMGEAEGEGVVAVTPPATIDELLDRAADEGTHTVLDVEHVGPLAGVGLAAPLPPAEVWQSFGTAAPTLEQVEAGWPAIAARLERWSAYYLPVYRDGRPTEYAFIGCSGD